MRLVSASILALALAAFAAPSFACEGHAKTASIQTTVAQGGPQTTVTTQTASETGK